METTEGREIVFLWSCEGYKVYWWEERRCYVWEKIPPKKEEMLLKDKEKTAA